MKYSFRAKMKYFLTVFLRNILKIFFIFPIKRKKILFFSFSGKQYSDSPKYISEALLQYNYKIVWAFQNTRKWKKEIPVGCKCIKQKGLSFLFAFFTSKVIVTNNYVSSYLPVRKKQFLINTWHGNAPLKTVGRADAAYTQDTELFIKHHEKKYSALLSSSTFITEEVFIKSLGTKSLILEYGTPRNDIFFQPNDFVKDKVYEKLGIEKGENVGLVLYAPTFRGNGGFIQKDYQLDTQKTIGALNKRFNKDFVFVFRAHHTMQRDAFDEDCINASDYPDMQELLCASDILITDYSSCMGDFAFTKRPVFLYIPDVKQYIKDRGFYWDIYSLPFCTAETQNELYDKILNYNEQDYSNDVDAYFLKLGSFEKGNATQLTCNWIQAMIEKT